MDHEIYGAKLLYKPILISRQHMIAQVNIFLCNFCNLCNTLQIANDIIYNVLAWLIQLVNFFMAT